MSSINKPGPLRAKVVEALGEAIFPKLASQCASVNCEEVKGGRMPFSKDGFCEECSDGMKWHDLRQVRESHGLMTSQSTGTLPVDHQEAILFARENRASIIKAASKAAEDEAAREEGLCSPCQLEITARTGGLDFDQHLSLMEARYDR